MRRKLEESTVVVTGASSGIGRATALAFARRGANVVVAARRQEPLATLARECGSAIAVPTDVADPEAVEALAARAVEAFGRLDVWVNNAAVSLFARLEDSPLELYRRVIETNFFGYVHGARAALRRFRDQGSGVLINNASVFATLGAPYISAYVASKWAVRSLGESLWQELSLDGAADVHVCTILPASIDTPFFQHAANRTGRAIKPLNPVLDGERVADAIVRLTERPRRERVVGHAGRTLRLTYRLAPAFGERMNARQVDRDHFEGAPAVDTDGNLLSPMTEWTDVSGGWKDGGGRAVAVAVLAGAIVPAAAALWFRRR